MPHPLGYESLSSRTPRSSWRTWWAGLASILLLAALLVAMWAGAGLFSRRSKVSPASIACHSNLRQIALASLLYANHNRGRFPDTAGTLLSQTDLTSEAFICRATRDVRAPGPTTQQYKQQLDSSGPPASGGCCSYVYVGGNLSTQSSPDCVVAYEPPGNHSNFGGWVAYADGRVEHKTLAQMKVIIMAQNPPP